MNKTPNRIMLYSQILMLVGGILLAIGGFSYYYFSSKDGDQKHQQLVTNGNENKTTSEEILNQLTGGQTMLRVDFSTMFNHNKTTEGFEWFLQAILHNPGPYKVQDIHLFLKERFKTMGKEDVVLVDGRLDHALIASFLPYIPSEMKYFDGSNAVGLFQRPINDTATALYFRATIRHASGVIEQTTILKKVLEEPAIRGYFWEIATSLQGTFKIKGEIVKKDTTEISQRFPLEKDGSVNWDTGWEN